MKILCVIPSRIASTRLPRKPLLSIQGKPMIQWTYENARRCPLINELIVATDDLEIKETITRLGGKVIMTDSEIKTGTERVASILDNFPSMDIVINLQGDEPFVTPTMLETLMMPYLNNERPPMTTLASPLNFTTDYDNPGVVKVITDCHGDAIYFTRSKIPYFRKEVKAPVYHHMGLYAFTREFLLHYQTLPETPLEKAESLEQLRVIEHGFKIRVCLTKTKSLEVNTQEEFDLAQHFKYVL